MPNLKAMKTFFYILTLIFFISSLNTFGQMNNQRISFWESCAREELKSALADKKYHNVLNRKEVIIKDSTSAINIAETIVFGIYGKENIINKKPYKIYLIDNYYWVISGTLPKGMRGGTFMIIIDARDCKVLRITHGR
jgi:NTF2 fold immunity protein